MTDNDWNNPTDELNDRDELLGIAWRDQPGARAALAAHDAELAARADAYETMRERSR